MADWLVGWISVWRIELWSRWMVDWLVGWMDEAMID